MRSDWATMLNPVKKKKLGGGYKRKKKGRELSIIERSDYELMRMEKNSLTRYHLQLQRVSAPSQLNCHIRSLLLSALSHLPCTLCSLHSSKNSASISSNTQAFNPTTSACPHLVALYSVYCSLFFNSLFNSFN